MMRLNATFYWWGLSVAVVFVLQSLIHVSAVLGQSGIVLPNLADIPNMLPDGNADLTENPGTDTPSATPTIGFDLAGMPITAMPGGAGGIENVTNLVNNITAGDPADNTAKWLDFQGDDMMMPVHITLTAPQTVRYYTLTSANDAPDRDPWKWRVLGTNVANPTMVSEFTVLETRENVVFSARDQTQLFQLPTPGSYTTYRFEFETHEVAVPGTPTAGNYDSIQLAEIEFFENFSFAGPVLTINRTTGAVTLTNGSASPLNMTGYSLTSARGSLNSTTWLSITNNYDGNDGAELDADNWIRLTETNGRNDLSEVENPNGTNGAVIAPAQSINLGNVWIKSPIEDVLGEILLADGTTQNVTVSFESGAPYVFGDLNFDRAASLTFADWIAFKAGQTFNFSTVHSTVESYTKGDLDGDFDHDLDDFAIFKNTYNGSNGAGAFEAMIAAIPEPSTGMIILSAAVLLGCSKLAPRAARLLIIVLLASFLLAAETAHAGKVLTTGLIGGDLTNPDNTGPTDITITAGDGATPSPELEMPPNLFDNSTATKWLTFQPEGSFVQIQFNSNAQHAVNKYTLTSANDAPERDPYRWTLSGSNDGNNFTVLDDHSGQTFSARGQVQQFLFANDQPFNIYRFDFTTAFGAEVINVPGTPNSFQLAEIELFDDPDPPMLTLKVDTEEGTLRLENNSQEAVIIDSYRIESPSGALNFGAWTSLRDLNLPGFPRGNGTGNGWEEGTGSNDNLLVEYYLSANSALGPEQGITIGNAFDLGGAEDLVFQYREAGTGIVRSSTVRGIVEYVGGAGVVGDYNGNGVVDAADYSVWRDNLGSTTNLAADGSGNGTVDAADYNVWKTNFGNGAGSGAGTSAIPEPSGLVLALTAPGLLLLARRRAARHSVVVQHQVRNMPCGLAAILSLLVLAVSSTVASASTVDRNYRFGDDPQENGVVGQVVTAPALANHTLDSATPFQDLMQQGGPVYANTQSTGRPGAAPNERGIQFTGSSSQFLTGAGLGSPAEGGGPIGRNYAENRLMQIWVRPTLNNGMRQEVVSDTFQFGIFLAPTAAMGDDVEVWGHTYGSDGGDANLGDDFLTTVPVVYSQWTHIMQRTFENDAVALYINGVAVARFNADYEAATNAITPEPNRNMYVGAASGGAANFFTGQLDSLKLHVAGNNTAGGGQDWGSVDLATENDYIAFALAQDGFVTGDVNGDGVVNGSGAGPAATDDVRFFIDHWLDEQRLNNFLIGDLISRTTLGDLNFDGRTSLADWQILRNAHAAGASLDLAALLAGGTVPEPSAAAMVILACLTFGGLRRKRGRILM